MASGSASAGNIAVVKLKALSNDDVVRASTSTTTQQLSSGKSKINNNKKKKNKDLLTSDDRTHTLFQGHGTIRAISGLNQTEDFLDKVEQFHHSRILGIFLYILLILFMVFLMCLSSLYGFGQLYTISLGNFWCDKSYTIDQIVEINKNNDNAEGSQYSCLATDAIADYDKLFATDPSVAFASKFDQENETRNYVFFIFYQCVTLAFLFVMLSHFYTTQFLILGIKKLLKKCGVYGSVTTTNRSKNTTNQHRPQLAPNDTIDTDNNEIAMTELGAATTGRNNGSSATTSGTRREDGYEQDTQKDNQQGTTLAACLCCAICGLFKDLGHFCLEIISVDTTTWVIIKMLSEMAEIWVQMLVLFQYGGTSFTQIVFGFDADPTYYTSQLPNYVLVFAYVILMNGLITGIFWCLYALFPSKVYGHSFNDALFICDGLFDCIYSVYPIIIAGALSSDTQFFELLYTKIGILQHTTWTSFLGASLPMLLLIKKCDAAMTRVRNIIDGIGIGDEYAKQATDLKLYKQQLSIASSVGASDDELDVELAQFDIDNHDQLGDDNHDEEMQEDQNDYHFAGQTALGYGVSSDESTHNVHLDPHNAQSDKQSQTPTTSMSSTKKPVAVDVDSLADVGVDGVDGVGDGVGTNTSNPQQQGDTNATSTKPRSKSKRGHFKQAASLSSKGHKVVGNLRSNLRKSVEKKRNVHDRALSHGLRTTITTSKGDKRSKKLFISHRKLLERQISREFVSKSTREDVKKRHKKRNQQKIFRRFILFCIGLFIIAGLSSFISLSVIVDTYDAENYCTSFDINNADSLDNGDDELLIYKQNCVTKVYKLFSDYPCDCRFFQITNEQTSHENTTMCEISREHSLGSMITNVFSKWRMLERIDIRTSVESACLSRYSLNVTDSSFFNSRNLQALVLQQATFNWNVEFEFEFGDATSWNDSESDWDGIILNYTSEFINNNLKHWENVIFFSSENIAMANEYWDIFFNAFGERLSDLIYFEYHTLVGISQWPDSWCNMHKSLRYFELSLHSLSNVDECIGNFDELEYFKLWAGATATIPLDLIFNLPKIKMIALNAEELTWQTLIEYFYTNSSSSSQFVGYNEDFLDEVYFQGNEACDTYNGFFDGNDTWYFLNQSTQYPQLFDLIEKFDACTAVCISGVYELVCPSFRNGNGVCNSECDNYVCDWDNNDCNQLCNTTSCDLLLNGDCNIACNSTECRWDLGDCISDDDYECPDGCEISHIGDGWCVGVCIDEINYPQCAQAELDGDCAACDSDHGYLCSFYFSFFISLTQISADNTLQVITQSDWCEYNKTGDWSVITSFSQKENMKCNNITYNPSFDLNLNGIIGWYEFLWMFGQAAFPDNQEVVASIDCSSCLHNASHYYL